MAVKNGLYSVRFINGMVDFGSGTVVVRDGALNGGDHGFSYQGRLEAQPAVGSVANVSGQVEVRRWNAQVHSVIPGLNDYALEVTGSYDANSQSLELEGKIAAIAGSTLRIVAKRIADLVE